MQGHTAFRTASLLTPVVCYVTILLGGNVIASDAGLGCPSWPTCFGTISLWPATSGLAAIEWAHRLSALVLAICVLLLAVLAVAYERRRPALLRMSLFALALTVALAFLGGAVVESGLAVALVLTHFALATLLFGLLLVLALLANLSSLPPRWVAWARQASVERTAPQGEATVPSGPASAPTGLPGLAGREG